LFSHSRAEYTLQSTKSAGFQFKVTGSLTISAVGVQVDAFATGSRRLIIWKEDQTIVISELVSSSDPIVLVGVGSGVYRRALNPTILSAGIYRLAVTLSPPDKYNLIFDFSKIPEVTEIRGCSGFGADIFPNHELDSGYMFGRVFSGTFFIGGYTNVQGNLNLSGSLTSKSVIKEGGTADQFLKADGTIDNTSYTTSADLAVTNSKTQNQSAVYGITTFGGTIHTSNITGVRTLYSLPGDDLAIGVLGNNLSLQALHGVTLNKAVTSSLDATTGPLSIGSIGATSISIGKSGIETTIRGTLVAENIVSTTGGIDASYTRHTQYFIPSAALVTTSSLFPIGALTALGSVTTATAQSSTSSFTKIFKVNNPTSSVSNGQKSGYCASTTFPKIYVGSGFIWNMNFGIGDTNAASTSICQMFAGFQTATVAPSFGSAPLGPNTSPNIFGIGCDYGDTVLSFYSKGSTTSNVKIATNFSCATPCTLWFNLTIYNQNNSNDVYITLAEQTTDTSVTQMYSMIGSTNILNTSLLYPIYIRTMASAGGTTGSAQTTFNKFQLFLK
jgi:hypothetical protein